MHIVEPKRLKTFSQDELNEWYKRIDDVFQTVKGKYSFQYLIDQIIAMVDSGQSEEEKLEALGVIDIEEIKAKEKSDLELTKTTKHTLQHNKIVDMMDSYGLLLDNEVKYLEYGAGKGLLSHYLHERIDEKVSKEEQKVLNLS